MGLDVYIEARITEKSTGYVAPPKNDYEGDGFFKICYRCGWDFCDIRDEIINISNKYNNTGYTENDCIIPLPREALYDVYKYIVSQAVADVNDDKFSTYCEPPWVKRAEYEISNLITARELRDIIYMLEYIEAYNDLYYYSYIKENIIDSWYEKIKANPQGFRWDFRIINSW